MKCAVCLMLIVSITMPGIVSGSDTSKPATGGDVLATVGDRSIDREMLDHIINTIPEENRVPFLTPDGRRKILDEVVEFTLFAEAARREGIDREPAVKTRLDYVQTEYLASEYLRRRLADQTLVTEEELKQYYSEHKNEFKPPEEIKARHILVPTEAEAKKVLEKVRDGMDFAEAAKKHSIDPAAAQGGQLKLADGGEWLPKGTFETSFEIELFKIPEGELGGPLKTQYGWHILKVEGRRQPEVPSYVQVRNSIRNRLQSRRVQERREKIKKELQEKIPVEIK